MLTPVHHLKGRQWLCEHQNWTTELWKKVVWSDESSFLLHHVVGWVCVHCLPGEDIAPGCTMGRRQASGGSVMLWAMFCWETVGLAIHVDVTLTCTTYLSIAADHKHPFTLYSLMAVASFSRIMHSVTKQKWSRNGLRSTTTTLRCCHGLQIPQISIQSICGMCCPIHGGPTSQLTGLKGSAAKILLPDTTAHLCGSSGVHVSIGQG